MSSEQLQLALEEAREAKAKAIEAYNYAQKAESDILHQIELNNLKLENRVDGIFDDVKLHRTILFTVIGVIGLAVLTAVLKVIGL